LELPNSVAMKDINCENKQRHLILAKTREDNDEI